MRAIYLLLPLLVVFLCFPGLTRAQSSLTVGSEVKIDNHGSYDFLIPADLDTLLWTSIDFELRGGDGGRAKLDRSFSGGLKVPGGQGAEVNMIFQLGRSTNRLRPGGTLRFIVGEAGQNCLTGTQCGGGGGGGTAVLYLAPGASVAPGVDTAALYFTDPTTGEDYRQTHWILLGVAAGGSGGVVNQLNPSDAAKKADGKTGRASTRGGDGGDPDANSGPNLGGANGEDGEDEDDANGGNGFLNAGWEGQPQDTEYEFKGGSGYGSGGSTKDRKAASGGGGGFSGGGAGDKTKSGGGGGSFITIDRNTGSKSGRGKTRFPKDGRISYNFRLDDTPADLPVVTCVDDFSVELTGGEGVTLTPADFDAGSSDPRGLPLTYEMCQSPDGVEFFCRDSKTWECNEVGDQESWYLAVSNGYRISYCQLSLSVVEKEARPICPLSGRTVVNLNGQCTKTFTAAELAHLNENGEALLSYADVLVSVTDNCNVEDLVFTLDQNLFTCDDRGVNRDIFLSAEDPAGNVGLCRVDITIRDQTAPEINCKDVTIELGDDGTYRLGVADVVATATDNCNVGYQFSQRDFTCDDLANSPISVTMRGRDATNNSSSCISLVTIAEPECPCLPADNVLIVDNPEDVALCADMTVSSVRFREGSLDLQGYELTIETDGGRILNEAATKRVFDFAGGSVVAFDLTDSDQDLIADLGIQMGFSSPGPFSFNEMRRSTLPVIIGEDTSISRVLTIDHDISQPFENIWISYFEAELNGTSEEDLELYIEENGVWSQLPKNGRSTEFNHLTFDIDFNNYTGPVRLTLAPASALLPLDLLSFTGGTREKTNVLKWSTVREEAFSHFIVERSADGTTWQDMGAVAGAGQGTEEQSEYTFTDAAPLPQNYYRLRMIDLDGSFTYSSVVQLSNEANAVSLRVYPNPSAGTFQLLLPEVEGGFDLALYTIHGTRVRAQKIGAGTVSWRMEDVLPSGIYLLSLTATNGKHWAQRVVVR